MKKIFILAVAILAGLTGFSQAANYKNTDAKVAALGPLTGLNVATIADTITRPFADKEQKARAIFYWIANNISLDTKATKGNDQRNKEPEKVVQLRKATPLAYSLLFQEMCSMAKIRCLSVDGYIKNFAEDINNKADELNHSWNVVQLGQSPEEWHYVDVSRAAGYTDKKQSTFTKQFTSEYFFADKALFNLDHFPDNGAWQLGSGGPKSVKDFYALPVISNAAYEYGLQAPMPKTGFIKAKTSKAIPFSFTYNGKAITSVNLVMGDAKGSKSEPMNFSANGSTLTFNYQFKKEDSFPVRVVVDGKDLLAYFIEVEE